jgi:hypothetical protein
MKKKSLSIICFALFFLVFSSFSVSAKFFSNFDVDDEGWVIYYGVADDGSFLIQSPEYCDGFICTDIKMVSS